MLDCYKWHQTSLALPFFTFPCPKLFIHFRKSNQKLYEFPLLPLLQELKWKILFRIKKNDQANLKGIAFFRKFKILKCKLCSLILFYFNLIFDQQKFIKSRQKVHRASNQKLDGNIWWAKARKTSGVMTPKYLKASNAKIK